MKSIIKDFVIAIIRSAMMTVVLVFMSIIVLFVIFIFLFISKLIFG